MKETIVIAGKSFSVPVRYMEGHVCTDREAEQLNRDIIGKARNNLAKKNGLTQDELNNWVDNFQFGTRNGGGRDPVVAEAKLIAKKMLRGKKSGKELIKAVDKLIAKNPKIIEMAQRRVKEMIAMSEAILRDGQA